ncbi:gluconokinase [Nitrincola nitratireducens]|uniref:gluconokinase n=1 Tax=Nitrincola nitratireducens TaxID=1229521 RepID=W9V075_9GAMM|nr:gluconokinase [Nitrincola nitratireducens]EXJ12868.1 Thermoresistant gluconokinase [Nitrincola nitratireducens]
MKPYKIVVMGVCGCGKSTLAKRLAEQLNGTFLEGDAFHTPENIAKMSSGIPLTDADRHPWLVSSALKFANTRILERLFWPVQA